MTRTTISALPAAPSRAASSTFAARADAWLTALPAFHTQLAAVIAYLEDRAEDASPVTAWVTGTTYAKGARVWSPADGAAYIAKAAHTSTTDPSADATNWARAGGLAPTDRTKLDRITLTAAVDVDDFTLGRLFTATGSIAADGVVALESDGTVSSVAGSSPTNADDWLGIASGSASDGQSVRVRTIGQVADGQTGLTVGSVYYLDDDGTLTVSAASGRKVGRALSATEILIGHG